MEPLRLLPPVSEHLGPHRQPALDGDEERFLLVRVPASSIHSPPYRSGVELTGRDPRYNGGERKEAAIVAIPVERTEREPGEETYEQKLARLRATPEERARVLASVSPFDYEAWAREAGPASLEELAEMEEFLRGRELERQRSLAHEEALGE
jgi:hypothetical protein